MAILQSTSITGSLVVSGSTVQFTDNVGIGTTSPLTLLHVGGGNSSNVPLTFAPATGGNVEFRNTSSTGTFTFTNQNGSQERVRIDASGNVGIGTTSPSAKLHVLGVSQNTIAVDSPVYPEITFRVGGTIKSYDSIVTAATGYFTTSAVGDRIYRTEAGNHLFGYSSNELMRITTSGNVGIGTASPSEKLDVSGRITSNLKKYFTTSISNSYVRLLTIGTTTNQLASGIRLSGTTHADSHVSNFVAEILVNHSGDITVKSHSGAYTQVDIQVISDGNGNFQVFLRSGASSTSTYYFTVEALTSQLAIYTLPSSTLYSTTTHTHTTNFGTNVTGTGGTLESNFSGNVGIGTASPSAKLHIEGSTPVLRLRTTSDTEDSLIHFADTSSNFAGVIAYSHNGNDMKFYTNATERMRIDSSGNVGIGTTSPSRKLSVNGVAGFGNGTIETIISFSDRGVFGTQSNHDLEIRTNGTERMRIDSSGNVGIGTTAKKNGYDSGFRTLSVSGNGTDKAGIIELQGNRGANGNQVGMIQFWNTNTSDYETSRISGINSTTSVYDGQLQFSTRTSGSALTTRMIITEDGDVGIGTTSPSAKLDIKGDGADFFLQSNDFKIARIQPRGTGADLDKGLLSLFDGSTEDVRIDTQGSSWFNGGNVGIGTSSPNIGGWGKALTVQGASNAAIEVTEGTVRTSLISAAGSAGYVSTDTNHPLLFRTNSTERMRIDSSGRVGIGTTSPGRKLHLLNGQIKFENTSTGGWAGLDFAVGNGTYDGYMGMLDNDGRFFIDVNSNGEDFTILQNGNVGIGTTSPANELTVNGDIGYIGVIGQGSIYGNTGNISFATMQLYNPSTGFSDFNNQSYGYNFKTGGSTKVTILNNGNVGIGNTAPNEKLELSVGAGVTGGLRINYASSATGEGMDITYLNNGATTTSFDSRYNSDSAVMRFRMKTAATPVNAMTILGSGNVGIGTTSPQQKLQVASPSDTSVVLGASYLSTNNNNFFEVGILANDGYLNLRNSGVVSTVHIDSDGNSYFNGGNVGIGTTSPDAPLTIHNSTDPEIRFGYSSTQDHKIQWDSSKVYIYADPENANGSSALGLGVDGSLGFYMDSSRNVGIGTTSPSSLLDLESSSTVGTQLHIVNTSTGGTDWRLVSAGSANSINAGYFGLYNSDWRMVVNDSGNVGIGTTSPAAKLEITGGDSLNALKITDSGNGDGFKVTSHTTQGTYIQAYDASHVQTIMLDARTDNGTRHTYFNGGGNVGIGTTSPNSKLSIEDGNIEFLTTTPATIKNRIKFSESAWGDESFFIEHDGSGAGAANLLKIYGDGAGGTEGGIVVTRDGNVGIGTTSPTSAKLQISSGASAGIRVESSSGQNALEIGGTGNVRIDYPNIAGGRFTIDGEGNVNIPRGDLTVGGTVTAQEFHTEFVSASIVFQSGSTKFGDTTDDVHSFTGSLEVTGSGVFNTHIGSGGAPYQSDDQFIKLVSPDGSTGTLVNADNGNTWLNADGGKDLWLNWYSLNSPTSNADLQVGDGEGGGAILTVQGSTRRVGIGTTSPSTALEVNGTITGNGSGLTSLNASNLSSGTVSDARLPGTISSDITGNAATATKWATARTITLGGDLSGNVSIDGSANVTLTATVADDSHNHDGRYYTESEADGRFVNVTGDTMSGDLTINGTLSATVKSFNIEHPTQEGKRLVYGVLEGNEHAVFVRGKSQCKCIELPEEWTGLVDPESITVQLTSIGNAKNYYFKEYKDNKIYIGCSGLNWKYNYFYIVHATRIDVKPLQTVQNAN
jgi:hypothetical protein